jgi:RNA polymerase sigma-70 factor (ECF subfamily)
MFVRSLNNESQLLRKIAEGDQHAFKIIYDFHRRAVYARAIFLLKSEVLAEEVLQEVMLKLWQSAEKLTDETNLGAYLTTLTRNRSFQILRRRVLEAKTEIELRKDWTESHNETEEGILLADTQKILADGIALLPPQQKMVYELCRVDGLKYEQAAQSMNLSVETVKSYMKLALRSLRAYMKSHTDLAAILIILKII